MSTNEEIVRLLQTGTDDGGELMGQLLKQNEGLIQKIANRYSGYAENCDLMQEGRLGLIEAVKHYQEQTGVSFIGYASFWIRQRMTRFIENDSALSASMYQSVRKYKRFVAFFEQEQGRPPTEEEICRLLGISKRQLTSIQDASNKVFIASLDSPIATKDGDTALGDVIPAGGDPEDSVLEQVEHEQLAAILWTVVDSLGGEMPHVIRERYQEQKTAREVSAEMECTQDRVYDIERKALEELRKPKRRKLLQSFADDYITTQGFHGGGAGTFNRTWTSSTERVAFDLMDLGL